MCVGVPWLLEQRCTQKAVLLSGTGGGTPGRGWTLYGVCAKCTQPSIYQKRKLRPPLFDSPGGSPAAHTLSQVFSGHQWESGWGSWGGQSQDPRPWGPYGSEVAYCHPQDEANPVISALLPCG